MNRKFLLSAGFVVMVVGALLVSSASAAPITVINASFEDPVLGDGEGSSTNLTPYSWGALYGTYTRILNPLGLEDDPAKGWEDATGDGTPRGGDGINILSQAVGREEFEGSCGVYNTLEHMLQAGTYTLTVAAGLRAIDTNGDATFEISLGVTEDSGLQGMLATESWDGSTLLRGEFMDKQLVWVVASDNPYIGLPLRITVGGRTTAAPLSQGTRYDNVRLDLVTSVPIMSPGNANLDGIVDDADAAILADNWQMQSGAEWGDGDFNADGKVDEIDATLMATNWGVIVSPPTSAVPEPSILVFLLVMVPTLLLLKRNK